MNVWNGIGYLGADVELRYTGTGLAVARSRIGVSRGRDKNGDDKGTDWLNIVAFDKTAENMEKFFHKGSQIGIVGHIQTGSYEKDGEKRYTTDIVVDRFDFCGKKEAHEEQQTFTQEAPKGFTSFDDEDIPF